MYKVFTRNGRPLTFRPSETSCLDSARLSHQDADQDGGQTRRQNCGRGTCEKKNNKINVKIYDS